MLPLGGLLGLLAQMLFETAMTESFGLVPFATSNFDFSLGVHSFVLPALWLLAMVMTESTLQQHLHRLWAAGAPAAAGLNVN